MNKMKKIFFWLAGIFVLLLFVAGYLAPRFINSDMLKSRIERFASEKVGGIVTFKDIELSLLPLPNATIYHGEISAALAQGTVESLTVYPELIPLLTGEFRVDELIVTTPDITLILPAQQNKDLLPESSELMIKKFPLLLAPFAVSTGETDIEIEDGSLHVLDQDKPVLSLEGMNSKFVASPGGVMGFETSVQSLVERMTVSHRNGELVIQESVLKGRLYAGLDKTYVSLAELSFDVPRLNLEGELTVDNESGPISLLLTGTDMDIPAVREAALAVAGDVPVIGDIFQIVKGGNIPSITFRAEGKSFADLGVLKNMEIQGALNEGDIFVPGPDLDLKNVSGDVVISGGILKGEDLEARLENATGQDGTLTIGLAGDDAPFNLDLLIKADLTQLPPLLRRLVRDETFVHEISRIYNVRGDAQGRLVLGDRLHSVKVSLDISEMNLSADYKRVPYPLKVTGGQLQYDGSSVSVRNLSGNVGKSFFSEMSADIGFGKDPLLEILSGKSALSLEEMYSWLSSYENLKSGMKEIQSVEGTLNLSELNLKGPLFKPENWEFQGAGDVPSLLLNTTLFPAPVKVKSGKFKLNHETLSLADTHIETNDASFMMSCIIDRYLEGLHAADAAFRGEIGPDATEWLSKAIHLPSQLSLRSPLSVAEAHLVWERDVKTSLKSDITVRKGPDVSIDILHTPVGIALNTLTVQDEESRASMSLNLQEKEVGFSFDGNLNQSTLDKIFVREIVSGRWIKGSFRSRVLKDAPTRSTFQGKLEGEGIILPWDFKVPFMINTFSLDADRNNIKVESAELTVADNHISLKGDITSSEKNFIIDMDLSADRIDWDEIKDSLASEDKEKDSDDKYLWDAPVRGTVRLNTENFTFDRFTWSPVQADISLDREGIRAAVTHADLCGIAFPGEMKVTTVGTLLDFHPVVSGKEVEPVFNCLFGISRYMTGTFDFQSAIKAEGRGEEIIDSLKGDYSFLATNGRIHQYGLLAKILAFINITEVFRGKMPDMTREGFAYETTKARADIRGSKMFLKEFLIDGASMEIASEGSVDFIHKTVDLKVLVAPLKTADFVIKKVPIIRDILGGTLVSIPVRVTGDLSNPVITYLSPSDIGSGLLGIMRNTFKVPVKVIEPATSGNNVTE